MSFHNTFKEKAALIDEALHGFLLDDQGIPSTLLSSMRYSLFAGGKRLRPILLLAANELMDGNVEEAMPLACGIEMIHTYSLIHDDLPGMDNDDLRRGKPTNHKVFGEGMAILAGDGLLSYAFELMVGNARNHLDNMHNHIHAIAEISKGAGVKGMVAGQCVDIESEGQEKEEKDLLFIHQKKTGALITASLQAGLVLNNPNNEQINAIKCYGEKIGLMFQIVDDLLDIYGDEKKMGKKVGSDAARQKATFPGLYGIKTSKEKVNQLTNEAMESIDIFGNKGSFLKELASYLGKREF